MVVVCILVFVVNWLHEKRAAASILVSGNDLRWQYSWCLRCR